MQDLIEKTANDLNLSKQLVETIIRHKYSWIREKLKNPTHVSILDTELGCFTMYEDNILKLLEKNLKPEIRERMESYLTPIQEYNKHLKEIGKNRENGKKTKSN